MEILEFIDSLENDKNLLVLSKGKNSVLCVPKLGGQNKRVIKIPLQINGETALLAGMIIGDGTLSSNKKKNEFRIRIDLADLNILNFVAEKFLVAFGIKPKVKLKNDRRSKIQRFLIDFNSKPIWLFLTRVLEIPPDKKSHIVKVPHCVLTDISLKREFITGLFLADGGRKGNRIAFVTVSKELFEGVKKILNTFEIGFFVKQWVAKSSGSTVFDIVIGRRSERIKFINTFPLTQLKLQGSPSLVNGDRLKFDLKL